MSGESFSNKNYKDDALVIAALELLSTLRKQLAEIRASMSTSSTSALERLGRFRHRSAELISEQISPDEGKKLLKVYMTDQTSYLDTSVRSFSDYFDGLEDDLKHTPWMVIPKVSKEKTPSNLKIFISYAWADEGIILAIDQWLRSKRLEVKIDRRDFFAGSRIRDEIMRNMKECNVVLIFHSEQSKDKPWIQFERELASDIEMSSKIAGNEPPRIIYVVIDGTPLPSVSEENRIAVMAKGKRFELVCEEIYHNILQLPKTASDVDLEKWSEYVF